MKVELAEWTGRCHAVGNQKKQHGEDKPSCDVIEVPGLALLGSHSLGGPARGRLEIAAPVDGDGRAGAIDVGRAGAILVLDARVDAETLSRARAMGVRGIVAWERP